MRWCVVGLMLFAGLSAPWDVRADQLQLASVHAQVMDLSTGDVLFSKLEREAVPVASITKLMTALVVLEAELPLDEWLTIVPRATPAPRNAYSRLRPDSQAQRADLLRMALSSSENLAAYQLGHHYPGGMAAFVSAMNAKAQQLGMHNTRFVDTTGLSEDNRSTAEDLLLLLRAAWQSPQIHELSTTGSYSVRFRAPTYRLQFGNTNPLVRRGDWDVQLSKTGYLDVAGRCLVMVMDVAERPMAVVLLNSFGTRSPIGDAGRIRRWLETGDPGRVAGPALEYEQRASAVYRNSGSN